WGVAVDDSAGVPLAKTPPGTFLRHTARMLVDALAPVTLLAALKHPLAACGLTPAAFRWRVRRLERRVLRGPRPAPGLEGLRAAVDHAGGDALIRDTLERLDAATRPFLELLEAGEQRLAALSAAHLGVAEALAAAKGEAGARRLWAGEAGEQALAFATEVLEAAHDAPPVSIRAYPALLDELMAGRTVRPRYDRHPRLAILGPLEARLISADVVVLAGLNEGTWPARADASPWMSRPMMSAFGLPEPERRVGLSAHDLAQGFCAPEVYLTRAARVERTPTVPSRWLVRLENVVRGSDMKEWLADGSRHLSWQALLDRPAEVRPVAPPAPCPSVAARPRMLSVTQIETWMRDPYSIYARYVLNLRRLEPLDADPSAADYGQFVHHALEAFISAFPSALPDDAEERLLALGRERLGAHEDRPSVLAFWWPRFTRIVRWFIEVERERRAGIAAMVGEVKGEILLAAPAGPFKLTARADRIDTLRDGGLVIIDYKTGAVPKRKEVEAGFAPQLPLEAAIATGGGFSGVPPRPVTALEHWRLHGKIEGGDRCPVKTADIGALAEEAIAGVAALVARFDLPGTPYPSRPRSSHAPKFSDYEHLARVREWSAGEEAAP
ncbi:MAG TPA: double-strand break repair protein AddB, partial [Rhodospirillales bacterium]|nr:double-strand break repair protein AddB [Rhodospirillales bacterium]